MTAQLISGSRRDRIRAVRETAETPALPAALRRVLYTDRDANVRAAAARRLADLAREVAERATLDEPAHVPAEAWLLDAFDDASPMVRDSVIRALARCGSEAAAPALRAIVAGERMWWLRRSAIYALAAIAADRACSHPDPRLSGPGAGASELAAFTAALGDPFWRVRQAAVRVLAVLGARDPEIREEVLAAPPSSTLAFLRSSWGPVAIEAPARAAAPSALPEALLDPDPAVVHARLIADRRVAPLALVELLCDPHEPLRVLAADRLAASRDAAALEAALDWLEEPRIPHVVDTVHGLLDSLGDPAAALAERALARTDRPGAGRWAIGWVVATHYEALFAAALERARRDPALRDGAIALADSGELVAWAADAGLAPAIAAELHQRADHDALARLDARHPRVRALQVDAAARQRRWTIVEAALAHPHHGPRAIAARWLVRAGRADATRFTGDADPAVREAALTRLSAGAPDREAALLAHATASVRDGDPWVQRAAIRLLQRVYREARELPAPVVEAACAAAAATDPVLRQYACRIPGVEPRLLACVLAGLADPEELVRAAAQEGLEYLPEADTRIRALLPALDAPARAMAHAWLARRLDEPALAFAREAFAAEAEPQVRRVLAGMLGIALPAEPVRIEASAPREPVVVPPVPSGDSLAPGTARASHSPVDRSRSVIERRPFGRAGFSVAPLAISGAYDLAAYSLDAALDAGSDLYFWGPGSDRMTTFLRRRRPHARVLTGTYHADPRAIRHDVEAALHTLRRDALDGFLLFWTRSPSRVDAAAFAVLDELRREGKLRAIGFSTHHRELARDAIAAVPWDVVMIRHSAAHPGIERELLPAARAAGTAIVTFSALTYGRMLAGDGAPTAAECYRYCLAQPGVTATISAPRSHGELLENLDALAHPTLPAERIAELRVHGTLVRAENQRFNILLRQPTRDAAAAARELLAAELPPEAEPRALPVATGAKRSRTRLGRRRR